MADTQRPQRIAALKYDPNDRAQERVEACNLCGQTRFCVLAWKDRYGFDTQSNLCLACGLVFLSPRLTGREYGQFYKSVYRPLVSAYHGRRIDHVTVQQDQAVYAAELMKFLAPRLATRPVRRVMDIGGSTGVIAEAVAKELHCTGVVLDPSPDELAIARAKGLETVCALLEDYDLTRHGACDLVLLCQTADHLLDVKSSLRKIHDILNEDGLMFIDIVDFRVACLRGGSVEEAVKIDHPYCLTRATLEAYLAGAGFAVQAMTFAPDHLHIGYLCTKSAPMPGAASLGADVPRMLWEIRQVQAGRRA